MKGSSQMSLLHQSTEQPQSRVSLFRLERQTIRGCVLLLLAAFVLAGAGCSKRKNDIRPATAIYGASERNGVTTSDYCSYQHSFVFKTPNTEEIVRAAEEQTPVLWNTSAAVVSFEPGKTYKFTCAPGRTESSVWGTDIYT